MSTENRFQGIKKMMQFWKDDATKNHINIRKKADESKDPLKAIMYYQDSGIYIHLSVIYSIVNNLTDSLEKMNNALDKLPKTEEFKEVREEVKEIKDIADSTLIPIKKDREKLEELQKRGNNIYG